MSQPEYVVPVGEKMRKGRRSVLLVLPVLAPVMALVIWFTFVDERRWVAVPFLVLELVFFIYIWWLFRKTSHVVALYPDRLELLIEGKMQAFDRVEVTGYQLAGDGVKPALIMTRQSTGIERAVELNTDSSDDNADTVLLALASRMGLKEARNFDGITA